MRDCRGGKENTAFPELNMKKIIDIEFENFEKISNFNNRSFAFYREAAKIIFTENTYNIIEHSTLHSEWHILFYSYKKTTNYQKTVAKNSSDAYSTGMKKVK